MTSRGEDFRRDASSTEVSVTVTGTKLRKGEGGEGDGTIGRIKEQVKAAMSSQIVTILSEKYLATVSAVK